MVRQSSSRREFLCAATAASSVALGDWSKLLPICPVSAAEVTVTPELVRFGPDIEPTVRLIEDTPREKGPAMLVEQLRQGLPYRNFLAALYLANLRMGVIEHPLAALHSTNQLTLDLPVRERLLPMFWALDAYKAQGPHADLRPLRGALPAAERAEQDFHDAMNAYDRERAERAIVSLARSEGVFRTIEPVWPYAARDWTFIGHFAIWVANTWRVLQTIGWQYAEPALRVMVGNIMGDASGLRPQPYAANLARVRAAANKLPANWAQAGPHTGLTTELLSRIRDRALDGACDLAAGALIEGRMQVGAVWDAVHLAGAEMLLCCQKNSEPLHANTVANALHYAFQMSTRTSTRLLVLLQAVAWMILFRSNMAAKGWLREPKRITELQGEPIPDDPQAAAQQILRDASYGPGGKPTENPIPGWKGLDFNNQPWRYHAAQRSFTFARRFPASRALIQAASRLLPVKADWDPHRIKFPVAAFENIGWVSPEWRAHMVAAASYAFLGADALDSPLAVRIGQTLRDL